MFDPQFLHRFSKVITLTSKILFEKRVESTVYSLLTYILSKQLFLHKEIESKCVQKDTQFVPLLMIGF